MWTYCREDVAVTCSGKDIATGIFLMYINGEHQCLFIFIRVLSCVTINYMSLFCILRCTSTCNRT